MSMTSIKALLNQHLQTFAQAQSPAMSVAWENRRFSPPEGEPYLRAFLLPASPRAAALGVSAKDFQRGTFQVDVMALPGEGWNSAYTYADALRAHFLRGTTLQDSYVDLTVEAAAVGPAIEDQGRFKLPVSINFYAYMDPA